MQNPRATYTLDTHSVGIVQEAVYEKLVRQVDDLSINQYKGIQLFEERQWNELYETLDVLKHMSMPDFIDQLTDVEVKDETNL